MNQRIHGLRGLLLSSSGPRPRKRRMAGISLGVLLVLAGVSHQTFARKEFQLLVPDWVPAAKDVVVHGSGVVEMGLGTALIALPRRRVPVGLLVAAFFVAVFPGNLAQFLGRREAFGLDSDRARLTRLFFQPPLLWWALWSTGAFAALRRKTSL